MGKLGGGIRQRLAKHTAEKSKPENSKSSTAAQFLFTLWEKGCNAKEFKEGAIACKKSDKICAKIAGSAGSANSNSFRDVTYFLSRTCTMPNLYTAPATFWHHRSKKPLTKDMSHP